MMPTKKYAYAQTSNYMHYKDYVGSLEFSEEDAIFHGRVVGIKAMILFEGIFNVRIESELHRKAALAASAQGVSLNAFVVNAIRGSLAT